MKLRYDLSNLLTWDDPNYRQVIPVTEHILFQSLESRLDYLICEGLFS